MLTSNQFERGAEWRKWDLHIHTPASFHWSGNRFEDANPEQKKALVDEMIHAMNAAEPAVFAIMDYWTFEGWFALQERLEYLVLQNPWRTLFTDTQLAEARKRLVDVECPLPKDDLYN